MLRKRIFVKSFSNGQIIDTNIQNSAVKLENFIADDASTYIRSGFKILFPTYKKQKAKLIEIEDDKFLEITKDSIRIIENNKLKIKKELDVRSSIKDTIVTTGNHHLKIQDEIILNAKFPENSAKIEFIYKVKKIISDISFKISGREYIPDEITTIKQIERIDLKEDIDIEDINYTTTEDRIFFINKKKSRTINYYHQPNKIGILEEKIVTDLPNNFYPTSIGYYENRLILASNNQLFLSRTDSPFDFKINTLSVYSAMLYEFNFGQKEKIIFLYPALRNLIIGTNKNLYISQTTENFLEGGKTTFKKITSIGSKNIKPTTFNDDLIYIDKENSIRLITYNYKDEDIESFDLTKYTKQFKNFKKIIQTKDSIKLINNNEILDLLVKQNNNILYGTFFKTKRSKGSFYDILQNSNNIYVITEKNDEYFVEKQEKQQTLPEEYEFTDKNKYLEEIIKKQEDMIFTDSSIIFDGKKDIKIEIKDNLLTTEKDFFHHKMEDDYIVIGNKTLKIESILSPLKCTFTSKEKTENKTYKNFFYAPTTITNLDYLEGEEVSILSNGGNLKKQKVTNGKIKTEYGTYKGIFGNNYYGLLITNNLVAEPMDIFFVKNIENLFLKIKHTKNFQIGFSLNNLQDISFAGYTYKNNLSTPLYTGNIKPEVPTSDWSSDIRLFIKTENHFKLLGIYYETSIAN